MQPQMTRMGILSCQVCVPSDWDDKQAIEFAEREYPCGTTGGWTVRKNGLRLKGDPERNPCSSRAGFVHIVLDA